MKKIDSISIEIMKDLTEFHGLIRKLNDHGFSKDKIISMVGNAFWYDRARNNMTDNISIWHKTRIEEILKSNPHLEKGK